MDFDKKVSFLNSTIISIKKIKKDHALDICCKHENGFTSNIIVPEIYWITTLKKNDEIITVHFRNYFEGIIHKTVACHWSYIKNFWS